MQRSYLLSIDFKVTLLTDWAAQLKINPLYAILSGFEVGDTPGVGTFYDFLNRLWDSDSDNLNPHVRPVKSKEVKKPKQKGAKAESVEKLPLNSCSRHLSRNLSPLMSILTVLYSDYTRKSSLSSLLNVNLLHRNLLQLPEMGLR